MIRRVIRVGTLTSIALAVMLLSDCGDRRDEPFSVTGRIYDSRLGCWVLRGQDGRKFELINLPEAFAVDSLAVWARFRRLTSRMSTCMVGEIVEVLDIERTAPISSDRSIPLDPVAQRYKPRLEGTEEHATR